MKKKYISIFIIIFIVYSIINIFFRFYHNSNYVFNENFVNLNNVLNNKYKYPKIYIVNYENTKEYLKILKQNIMNKNEYDFLEKDIISNAHHYEKYLKIIYTFSVNKKIEICPYILCRISYLENKPNITIDLLNIDNKSLFDGNLHISLEAPNIIMFNLNGKVFNNGHTFCSESLCNFKNNGFVKYDVKDKGIYNKNINLYSRIILN